METTLEFKGAKTAPQISALSQMTSLKIANSAPMQDYFRSRGLFPLLANFPPYRQIMKIHHILYLSNTHLLGSRYCLCKNLLQCMILQLRILIVVKNRQTLKHHVKEQNVHTYLTLIQPFSKIDLFPKSVYFLTVQALQEITPKRHL